MRPLHILRNATQLLALLRHDLRDLLKQHIEITHALFDVADLLFAFRDQGILEVDLVLRGQPQLLLQLLLLLLLTLGNRAQVRAFFLICGCGPRGGDRSPLFLEGLALEGLEFFEG